MNEPLLMKEAYAISSCGLGVQTAIVQSLIKEKTLVPALENQIAMGGRSNLISHPLALKTLRPEEHTNEDQEYEGYFGEKGSELQKRYERIKKMEAQQATITLRSALQNELVKNARPITKEEFKKGMEKLAGKKLGNELHNELYESKDDEMDLGFALGKAGINAKEFSQKLKSPLKDSKLASFLLKMHTEKLALMTGLFEEDVKKQGTTHQTKPQDPDGKLSQKWQELFGEELPTIHELIAKAKETLAKAEKHSQ